MNSFPESSGAADRKIRPPSGMVEQLIAGPPPLAELIPRFLAALRQDLNLDAVAIWRRQGTAFLLLQEHGLRPLGWLDQPAVKPIQARLLSLAEHEFRPISARSNEWPELMSLPPLQLIVAPLQPTVGPRLLLQVFVRQLRSVDELKTLELQLLMACQRIEPVLCTLFAQANPTASGAADLIADAREPARSGGSTISPDGGAGLLQLSLSLQQDLSIRHVSQTTVNDGRLWLKCDRVSLWSYRGGRLRPMAVSGQAVIHKSSPAILKLQALAERLIRTGRVFVYPAADTSLSDELGRRLAEYVAETNSRQVVVIPLFRPERPVSEEQHRGEHPKRRPGRRPYGCLIAEQLGEHDPLPGLQSASQSLAECVAPALWGARRFEGVFLQPFWRRLGDLRDWILDGRLGRTAALGLFVVTAIALCVFLPWEYRVEATGRLMPVERSELFAPQDAEVEQVLVASGERVTVDQPLVRLRNRELDQQIAGSRKELDEQRQLLRSLQSQLDGATRRADRDAEIRLQGQLLGTQVLVQGLELELSILQARSESLVIASPVAGTVATFQIDQVLRRRPVHRGELLVSVMDEQGTWQLELEVADSRLGHVLRAAQSDGGELPLEFLLVTQPEKTYHGTVREIATATATDNREGLVVPVLANFASDQAVDHRIGAEVRARIHCGPQPLGYVLFGDVLDFVQRRAWWW